MRPQVLLGTGTDHLLHPLIDTQAVGLLAYAGEVFQWRMDDQPIARAILEALLSEGHHTCLAQTGELAGRRHGRGRNTKQRHEETLLASVVLIRRIPDGPTGTQHFEHATH